MTDWKTTAEIFAVAQRHMKLQGSEAIHGALYLGSILNQLATPFVSLGNGETRPRTDAETEALIAELKKAQAAFERVKPGADT